MSKKHKPKTPPPSRQASTGQKRWLLPAALLVLGGVLAGVWFARKPSSDGSVADRSALTNTTSEPMAAVAANPSPENRATSAPPVTTPSPTNLPTLEINQAVMVTVELDFGPRVPSIAEALDDIERRYEPDDGFGRVFAILDAYGNPTADGKKLHMSMHVSTEKPGIGSLVFRRTGEVLWKNRVVQGTNVVSFTGKNLTILLDDGAGRTFMVDGSGNPASLLDARLRDTGMQVRDFWPDGAEREVTCIYSACGCPVKFMVRRVGERTMRTKDLPVIFPDDPAVVQAIARLLGWRSG